MAGTEEEKETVALQETTKDVPLESGLFAGLKISPSKPSKKTNVDEPMQKEDDKNDDDDKKIATTTATKTVVPSSPAPRLFSEEEDDILISAIATTTTNTTTDGSFIISSETPIPNSDSCLRIIRKFYTKSCPLIPQTLGGTQTTLYSYIPTFLQKQSSNNHEHPYQALASVLNNHTTTTTADKVVDSILGTGTGEEARMSLSHFLQILQKWSLPPTIDFDNNTISATSPKLLVLSMDCATSLVAHGCLDGVIWESQQSAVSMATNCILRMDISTEETELMALKFLLTTGCGRTVTGNTLLQIIRVCYHVYLKTQSQPNKLTARAALRQITVSVFTKLTTTNTPASTAPANEDFPSNHHRDAYLVLRSLCKLSMRSLPEMDKPDFDAALKSKVLALDLLLYMMEQCSLDHGPPFLYALRQYLCVSLLKNCTCTEPTVVHYSLKIFVPLIRHFRFHLKTEIEAFVTNVFFVLLESDNSTLQLKTQVVSLFQEICSDNHTLAEIFLNYDCDLSAVDLFQRIVNTLAKVAKNNKTGHLLRLEALKAVRQILASLHSSIIAPLVDEQEQLSTNTNSAADTTDTNMSTPTKVKQSLVQIYDSKKKRREEESRAILRFNQKPSSGIKYATECGLINGSDPAEVAQYLLHNKDALDKTMIGEYLGREPEYQNGFPLLLLHEYVNQMSFEKLDFDEAIRYYLSGFRLPGEAQKIDRIMEKFAERYTIQNPNVFPTADAAFILAFSIIMLNTDLHNPAIKEERRMTKEGFIRNNRGICDGKDLPEELLTDIFDRIKTNQISLKEDDEARDRETTSSTGNVNALNPAVFFSSHYYYSSATEEKNNRESNFHKERDQIVRNTESALRRQKHNSRRRSKKLPVKFVKTHESGLKDEYVTPMFDVTWAAALAVFSTAMESADKGVVSDTEESIKVEAESEVEALEVCLNGFQLAICTAGMCGNDVARGAFVRALAKFSMLGSGKLLEFRHIRCTQILLELGRDDGELLGNTWEFVFRCLSEVARLRQVYELSARNHRAVERREQKKLQRSTAEEEKEKEKVTSNDHNASSNDSHANRSISSDEDSFSSYETDFTYSDFDDLVEDHMDTKKIDELNAQSLNETVAVDLIDSIYHRSASLSSSAAMEFIYQLCRVSRMEISGYGGHVGSEANSVDLTELHYRQHHTLSEQPDIFSLQKVVEVTHYNMDSRPKLVFSNIWNTVSAHLTSTALHSNAAVAMYAVDSFRQLSIHFLKFKELDVFEFQRRFLKPLETVMHQCHHSCVKELLLKCVEQTILLFGQGNSTTMSLNNEGLLSSSTIIVTAETKEERDTLRSGWKPVMAVIGIASQDDDDMIAELGFQMLTTQLKHFIHVHNDDNAIAKSPTVVVLRAERFVDLVDALLMYVSSPKREQMSLSAMEHLVTLCHYLADPSIPLPATKKQPSGEALELWWPILLGLSRTVGDTRTNIRVQALSTLFNVIHKHFFQITKDINDNLNEEEKVPQHGDLQTLQLIFRGVLTPTLEHADVVTSNGNSYDLPDGFIHFITEKQEESKSGGGRKDRIEGGESNSGNDWLGTTFDHLMDGCISLCLKSMETYQTDLLIEEVLAMFNNCLISDSGALAIRGIKKLHHFITNDLEVESITDDTWATLCHLLNKCLRIRGIPSSNKDSDELSEFVLQEEILADRRYIFPHATHMIGALLTNKTIVKSMGMRWYLFLVSGLGEGIQEWERAAAIMDMFPPRNLVSTASGSTP